MRRLLLTSFFIASFSLAGQCALAAKNTVNPSALPSMGEWFSTNGPEGASIMDLAYEPVVGNNPAALFALVENAGVYKGVQNTDGSYTWADYTGELLPTPTTSTGASMQIDRFGNVYVAINKGLSAAIYVRQPIDADFTPLISEVNSQALLLQSFVVDHDFNVYFANIGNGASGIYKFSGQDGRVTRAVLQGQNGPVSYSVPDNLVTHYTPNSGGDGMVSVFASSRLPGSQPHSTALNLMGQTNNSNATWSTFNAGMPSSINSGIVAAMSFDHNGSLYAALSTVDTPATTGMYKLAPGDSTWSLVNDGLPSEIPVSSLASDQNNNMYAAVPTRAGGSMINLYELPNAGSSWEIYESSNSPSTPYSIGVGNGLTHIVGGAGNSLYLGNASGVYLKDSQSSAGWDNITSGLNNSTAQSLVNFWSSPSDSSSVNTVYAGTGGGVYKLSPTTHKWVAVNQGFSAAALQVSALTVGNNHRLYAAIKNHGIYELNNSSNTWESVTVNGELAQTTSTILAVDSDGNIYCNPDESGFYLRLYKFIPGPNGGVTEKISIPHGERNITAFVTDSHNDLYVGTQDDNVYQYSASASSPVWCDIPAPRAVVGAGKKYDVSTLLASGESIYAGLKVISSTPQYFLEKISASGSGICGMETTTVNGAIDMAATSNFTGLTKSTNANVDTFYVSSDKGQVHFTSGADWVTGGTELPEMDISSLIFNPSNNSLYAGVQGHGVYSSVITD